jgi:hypothetical protein
MWVMPYLTDDTRLGDWLDFQDKTSNRAPGSTQARLRKNNSQGKLLLSDVSDFERQKFTRDKAYGNTPSLTQADFDKKYFNADLFRSKVNANGEYIPNERPANVETTPQVAQKETAETPVQQPVFIRGPGGIMMPNPNGMAPLVMGQMGQPNNAPINTPQQQPAVSPDQVKLDAEAELLKPTDDGRQWADMTDIEKKQRVASAKKMYGVSVDEANATVTVPDTSKQEGVQELNKNRFEGKALQSELDAQEKLDQKDWSKLSEEEKQKLTAKVQIEHGVSVDENGKAVKADGRFEEFMNRVGGHFSNIMRALEKIGTAFGNAFGKKNPNTPASSPTNNPNVGKIKNQTEFDTERRALETASNSAKGDPDSYRSSLAEEKRILELPEHQQYKSPQSIQRLAAITKDLKRLEGANDAITTLKGKPMGEWAVDAAGKVEYKQLNSDFYIKKENGVMSALQADGTWKEARKAANIQEGKNAQIYEQVLDRIGQNGDRWVDVPDGEPGRKYGHLTDDPTVMISQTRDAQGLTTIMKFDPLNNIAAGGTWVKF